MCIKSEQQVGVSKCPLAVSLELSQRGRESVAFYSTHSEDIAADSCCNCRNSYCGRSSLSHRSSAVKPIEEIGVTTSTVNSSLKSGSSSPTSSQTPPTGRDSEWSLMTTMGWIAAKSHQSPRVRVRWTAHRKLRRCKRHPTSSYGIEFNVNYKYNSAPLRSCIRTKNHEANIVHKPEQNHIIKYNPKTSSDTSHAMDLNNGRQVKPKRPKSKTCQRRISKECPFIVSIGITLVALCLLNEFQAPSENVRLLGGQSGLGFFSFLKAEASLIIGDSAIEIQEIDASDSNDHSTSNNNNNNNNNNLNNQNSNNDIINQGAMQSQGEPQNELIFGSTGAIAGSLESPINQENPIQNRGLAKRPNLIHMPGPLAPIVSGSDSKALEDITDGDKRSRDNHDYDIHELNLNDRQAEKDALKEVFSVKPEQSAEDKAIAGKVVDFELTPAGGHNKAKIKKKKKQKKEEEMFKKWGKKKKSEKKAEEKKHKEMMKKKKEEEKKGKKKWGKEEHGLKKKGKFKKKKWGKKVKKGKGVKKGKKGKKFLKDVGHKNTGFKTVYHKEEWGKSSKWHDIKRQKKWDEKSKKWKKKWKKEKGKKYKGDHMKKFEKKKKSGKKYKKESKDKFKKFKKEKFEKGKKKHMEEKSKKKEGGAKKMMKESKKKKKKM